MPGEGGYNCHTVFVDASSKSALCTVLAQLLALCVTVVFLIVWFQTIGIQSCSQTLSTQSCMLKATEGLGIKEKVLLTARESPLVILILLASI